MGDTIYISVTDGTIEADVTGTVKEERIYGEERNCEQLQEEKPLEEMFAELDLLAEKLENRDTSLEDSFILYRQGMELLKLCSGKLDTVEKKMLQLNEDGTFSEFSR